MANKKPAIDIDAQIEAIENPHCRKVARLANKLSGTENWCRDAYPQLIAAIMECHSNELAEQASREASPK